MTFSEQLIFLMELTSTSNRQLADAVAVDPSLISLMRTGRRMPPRNNTHLRKMAAYFAKKCEGNYQRMALSEAMGRSELPAQLETSQLAAILLEWLTEGRGRSSDFVKTRESFGFSGDSGAEESPRDKNDGESFAYYGRAGKRAAFEAFLTQLLTLENAGTVLYSSDEDISWLTEEPVYLERMQAILLRLLGRGFRVRRIAAPVYTAEQAGESFTYMLPLYMTGQLESSYYPRLRDSVYRRTVAVLPGVACVCSTSIAFRGEPRLTFFSMDKRAVNALKDEFDDYMSLCRPMLDSYTRESGLTRLLDCVLRFEGARGDRVRRSASLSLPTTPDALLDDALEGASAGDAARLSSSLRALGAAFRASLDVYETVDVHMAAAPCEVREGRVPISASYLSGEARYYSRDSYALHLKSILEHMERYDNYTAVLAPWENGDFSLEAADGHTALFALYRHPFTLYELLQPGSAEVCREYMRRWTEPLPKRRDTIERLRHMISELTGERSI